MGPYKCPDCSTWWAGLEHRCRPTEVKSSSTSGPKTTSTYTVRCNCPPGRGKNCPVHDVQVTYT